MTIDLSLHPCFNAEARHRYGRVHLPVAAKCNIQCMFCNRKYDCLNESRPGVTSRVLSPLQAVHYLGRVVEQRPETTVVGIAGPGDPFANPSETMQTLHLVKQHFPEMLLCVATNGLNIGPYIDELAQYRVSHVTLTVNAVDPEVGTGVYRWARDGIRIHRGTDAARLLMERQLSAIRRLKEHGLIVKINTVVIPGINDTHVGEIARQVKDLGADIMNCMPVFPAPGSDAEGIVEPSGETMNSVRDEAKKYMPLMTHCARCRADAVGLIGEELTSESIEQLSRCCTSSKMNSTNVAVASIEGLLINQHLGTATELHIFGPGTNGPQLLEKRRTPDPGGGDQRWHELAATLSDCRMLLVAFAGERPRRILADHGIEVVTAEGVIDQALSEVFAGRDVPAYMTCAAPRGCGSGCGGGGGGCGA